MLFELNPEKIESVLIIPRGNKRKEIVHVLRVPKGKDWIDYDRSLAVAMEDAPEKNGVRWTDNGMTAACNLWDSICQEVKGYSKGEAPKDWKKRVPPEHKKTTIQQLLLVYPDHSDSESEDCLFLSVGDENTFIRAFRGIEYTALRHTFNSPSPEQRIVFSRITSDSYLIKDREGGPDRVVFPSCLSEIIKIYNALIKEVAGYSIDGKEGLSREEIIKWMDVQHKRAALQVLMRSDKIEVKEKKKGAE